MIELTKVPPELLAPILAGNLRQIGPARKLIGHFLEAVQLRLAADACWLTRAAQGERLLPGERLACGDPALCDEGLAQAYLRREHPQLPERMVLATLTVHGRQVAVAAAVRRRDRFEPAARRALERLSAVLALELESREEERLARVLDRIREKVASELRPRDLAYQILDGLHQLVDYDHSSAFLAYERESGCFRIEAEKIVWTKAKSPFVGREIRLPAEQIGRISRAIEIRNHPGGPWRMGPGAGGSGAAGGAGNAAGGGEAAGAGGGDAAGGAGNADGGGEAARPGDAAGGGEAAGPGGAAGGGAAGDAGVPGDAGDGFGQLLDYHRLAGSPPISSQLSAPLFYDGEFLGMLEIAAWQRPAFAPRDLQVVERFLPAAAVAMRNARVNRSLEMQAVEAEVKATLVTLSHAVAHDVNNAVGSILPLAQQMRFDLRHGETLDLDMFDRDLGVIIDSARLCQRIFSNMLRVAGSGRASDGPVDAAQVVAETMPLLLALAARRGIEIALDLAPGLPAVRCRRQDLQHIVLNLVRNSLQALAEGDGGGGRVQIALQGVHGGDCGIELAVTDDGPGIPAELLSKVQEPFFSTRPGGSGLGLSICRALAWQNGGSLTVESPIAGGGPAAPVELVLGSGPPASAAAGRELTAPEDTAAVAAGGTRVTLRLGATLEPVRPQEVS